MPRSPLPRRSVLAVGIAVSSLAILATAGPAGAAPAATSAAGARAAAPAVPDPAAALAKAGRTFAARRHAAVTLQRAATRGVLEEGQTLGPGDALTSPSGQYSLVMGTDGALVLQKAPNFLNPQPYALTFAEGPPGTRLVLQTDGNLVLYAPDNTPIFSSGVVTGDVVERLVMQDDGNAVLYDNNDRVRFDFLGSVEGLVPGGTLLPGESVSSAGGGTQLLMQTDGNLVLYQNGVAVFSTGTFVAGAGAVLQSDGNFVVYSRDGRPLFDTHTSSGSGVAVLLLTDGEFRVLTIGVDGEVVGFGSAWGTSTLQPDAILLPGDRRTAPGGVILLMQTDGNLVEYVNGAARFASRTQASLGYMQPDGNFVLYSVSGTGASSSPGTLVPVFDTHTGGFPGSRLVVQTDTNLVVYTPANRPVYSSQS